jgi:aerobic C4-dicarboxylate transport protein
MQTESGHKPFYKHLYVQVLIAIAIGVIVGYCFPATAETMKPLGDGFINRWVMASSS